MLVLDFPALRAASGISVIPELINYYVKQDNDYDDKKSAARLPRVLHFASTIAGPRVECLRRGTPTSPTFRRSSNRARCDCYTGANTGTDCAEGVEDRRNHRHGDAEVPY